MTGAHPGVPGADENSWKPPFMYEGTEIFLRCFDDDDNHIGDLRIAVAEAPMHANTLVNAANAGMRVMTDAMVDRAIDKMRADLPTTEGEA